MRITAEEAEAAASGGAAVVGELVIDGKTLTHVLGESSHLPNLHGLVDMEAWRLHALPAQTLLHVPRPGPIQLALTPAYARLPAWFLTANANGGQARAARASWQRLAAAAPASSCAVPPPLKRRPSCA